MPYLEAGSIIDLALGLGGNVVDKMGLVYQIVMALGIISSRAIFFTSVKLFKHLKEKNIFTTGTIWDNRTEKTSLIDIKEMEKKPRETYKVVVDFNNDIAVVRWKDNKAATVAST